MSNNNLEYQTSPIQIKKRKIDNNEQQPIVMAKDSSNRFTITKVWNEEDKENRPQTSKLASKLASKMDIDRRAQEMFNWMTIKDIHSLAETCTRMKQIAADYIQVNLTALEMAYDGKNFNHHATNMNGFEEFVQKLKLWRCLNDEGYRFVGLHCKSLKQLEFISLQMNSDNIEHLKPVLNEIESVQFNLSHFDGEFYENFLKFCPRLKQLCLWSPHSNVIIGENNEWLSRSYPGLEHLQLHRSFGFEVSGLELFFERNPNLKTITFDGTTFLINMNAMLNTKIKLQGLGVITSYVDETFCGHLSQLHDQGFYQQLHLKVWYANQQKLDDISSLEGLEKLYLHLIDEKQMISLESLTSLTELGLEIHVDSVTIPIDLQLTAKKLENLERLYIACFKSEIVEPFIQYATKLKAIKIRDLNEAFLDVSALNKEREKLVGARKVTIYLEDEAFVATKSSFKTSNFKMIEVKRTESHDWQLPLRF